MSAGILLPFAQFEREATALARQLKAEVAVGTWQSAKGEDPDITDAEVRASLQRLNPL